MCLAMGTQAEAQEAPAAVPSVATEMAVTVTEPVPAAEGAVEEPPAPTKVACHDSGGMAQEPTEGLSAFYHPQQSAVTVTPEKIIVDTAGGAMVVNGVSYSLHSIAFPRTLAVALADESYGAEVLFMHDAADGSKAVLVVPVREGVPNVGMEKILSGADGQMVDPNDFMPAVRQYTPTGKVFGEDCSPQQTTQYFELVSPIEFSAQQMAKLKAVNP